MHLGPGLDKKVQAGSKLFMNTAVQSDKKFVAIINDQYSKRAITSADSELIS